MDQINIQIDRQTNLKMTGGNNINSSTRGKNKTFPTKIKLWKSEHLFKKYGWTPIKIYLYTECNEKIEPVKYLEKYTLDRKKNVYSMVF